MEDEQTSRLRAELAEVEMDLVAVRKIAAQLRENVPEAEDPADRGALIQSADEQDEIADQLLARRDDLRQRVAQAEHH